MAGDVRGGRMHLVPVGLNDSDLSAGDRLAARISYVAIELRDSHLLGPGGGRQKAGHGKSEQNHCRPVSNISEDPET